MNYWIFIVCPLYLYPPLAIQEPFTLVDSSFLGQTAPRGGVVGYKCYLGKTKTRNAINNVCIFSGELELARSRGLCGKFRWIKNVCKRKRLLPMGNWIPYSGSNTMNLTTLQKVLKYMFFLCGVRKTFADQYRQRFKVTRNTLEPWLQKEILHLMICCSTEKLLCM